MKLFPLIAVLMLALVAQQAAATSKKTHYYNWEVKQH